jgi:N-hydroxyarylamine O-acetyltransferase
MLDLEAYLSRIEYDGPRAPTVETLHGLHLAHATHVPFENLDIQMGFQIRLDLQSLQDKLVRRRRGGYCFEQNSLFQAALRAIGFDAIPCEARVRQNATGQIRPRTHMVLIANAGGKRWLCDVGFGGDGLLYPLELDGEPHMAFGCTLRVAVENAEHILQQRRQDGWEDLYVFLPDERYPIDFEVANWFTSTWPESVFVKTLTVQRPLPEVRHILRGLTYMKRTPTAEVTRPISREALIALLHDVFGLDLPESARFRSLDG